VTSLTVNGVDAPELGAAGTWSELLATLDAECERRGLVVTVVRFDDVEQPTFRGADLATRTLADVRAVRVDAVAPEDLLRTVLDEATSAIEQLERGAERLGPAFRALDVTDANRDLAGLAESLSSLVGLTATVAAVTAVELSSVPVARGNATDLFDELASQTAALTDAQRRGDWVSVADTLQHDLTITLSRWPTVLASLRGAVRTTVASSGHSETASTCEGPSFEGS
jgi:hypothetical protein